ncbi:hypothetical protein [Flavobacterium sp.]|uniref:glucosamine inositolphosphorylceramide transferase family protein n=1 Tax=Flavobacterium sp. TaxID=239 RepID=UPI002608291D|nr:hypothetical protein [Flavobacterium sp.]
MDHIKTLFKSMIKYFINLILFFTWENKIGRSVKIKLKKTKFDFQKAGWSIMIYDSEINFLKQNWIKRSYLRWDSFDKSINNIKITGYADPFLVPYKDQLFLFFEAIVDGKGEIWVSELINGKMSNPKQALAELFHLSYPNVFAIDGVFYMIPESSEDKSIRLYKSIQFPFKWELDKILVEGKKFVDTNCIEKNGSFYWFTYDLEIGKTRLFFSESFLDEWFEHKNSPFESNRNAGEFFLFEDKIIRPVQLAGSTYGEGVKLMEIKVLHKENYIEETFVNPFLEKGNGFNLDGSHHISSVRLNQKYCIAIDGKNNNFIKIV